MSDPRYYKVSLPIKIKDAIEQLFDLEQVRQLYPSERGAVVDFIIDSVRKNVIYYQELYSKKG